MKYIQLFGFYGLKWLDGRKVRRWDGTRSTFVALRPLTKQFL